MHDKFNEEYIVTLRYKIFGSNIDKLIASSDALSMLLRVHLLSESILEELIRLIFDDKAHAVLSLNLTYKQKLDLVSKFRLSETMPILEDYIVGSLRKLNSLRNKLAHNIDFEIENKHIYELYTKPMFSLDTLDERDVHLNLKDFAMLVLPDMLPVYEVDSTKSV